MMMTDGRHGDDCDNDDSDISLDCRHGDEYDHDDRW